MQELFVYSIKAYYKHGKIKVLVCHKLDICWMEYGLKTYANPKNKSATNKV
jgi:hypothetical protein